MKKFLIDFKKNNPFLFSILIISFLIFLIPSLYFLIVNFLPYKYTGFYHLIPFACILLVQVMGYFLYKKFVWITRVLTFILNTILILSQLILGMLHFAFWQNININYIFDKPEYYERVLKAFSPTKVYHFPTVIPAKATNIKLDGRKDLFFDGRELILKFSIDEEYVKKEYEKYDFRTKKVDLNDALSYLDIKDWGLSDFTFLLIDREVEVPWAIWGIAVNKDFSEIIYYYYQTTWNKINIKTY